MMALMYSLIGYASSGFLQRLLVGSGLTLLTAATLAPMVDSLLAAAVSSLSSLPAAALQLALLSGVGQAMNILGSALVARVALNAASKFVGVGIAQ